MTRSAPAAAARCMSSVKASARCWTGCQPQLRVIRIRRPKYGCRTCGTVVPSAQLRSGSIAKRHGHAGADRPGAGQQILRSYSALSARRRSSPATASSWTARRSRTGSVAPAGGSRLCMSVSGPRTSSHRTSLFADDTPVPVLDPGRGRTKTGRLWVYARERSTLGWTWTRRQPCISSRRTARQNARPRILSSSGVFCRSTVMPASRDWPSARMSSSHSVGHTYTDATFMMC